MAVENQRSSKRFALGLVGLEKPPEPTGWIDVVKKGHNSAHLEIQVDIGRRHHRLFYRIDERDRVHILKDLSTPFDDLLVLAYGSGRNVKREDVPPNPQFARIASLFGNNGYLKNIRDSYVYELVIAHWPWLRDNLNKILVLADENAHVSLERFDAHGFYFRTATDRSGETRLESMSDGFRATFVWLFDMLVRAIERGVTSLEGIRGIVMIDEIDLHLHPTWQRTLMPVIDKLFPNVQFIVTTHSPFVVQSWHNNKVFMLENEDDHVTVNQLEVEGMPFGHDIEGIISKTIALESKIPTVSHKLFEMIVAFDQAVEREDRVEVNRLYSEINAVIPTDSGYRQYLEIMIAGFKDAEVEPAS